MNPVSLIILVSAMSLVIPNLGVQARGHRVTPKNSKRVRSVNRRSAQDRKKHQRSCGCFSKKVAVEKNKEHVASFSIKKIKPQVLRKKILTATEQVSVAVCVLPEDVYKKCHIKESINIPLDNLLEDATKKQVCELCNSKEVILYCFSDLISSFAAEALKQDGCDVLVCSGGLIEWVKEGLEIEGEWADKDRMTIVEELEKIKEVIRRKIEKETKDPNFK